MKMSDLLPYGILIAGDTWIWNVPLTSYPNTTWTLNYYIKRVAGDTLTITASPNSDGSYDVRVSGNTTESFAAGDYKVIITINSVDERHTLGILDLKILPDPANLPADYDPRSFNEKALAAIDAVLFENASRDYLETVFKDATFKYKSTNELFKLRNYYRQMVDLDYGIKPGRLINL